MEKKTLEADNQLVTLQYKNNSWSIGNIYHPANLINNPADLIKIPPKYPAARGMKKYGKSERTINVLCQTQINLLIYRLWESLPSALTWILIGCARKSTVSITAMANSQWTECKHTAQRC